MNPLFQLISGLADEKGRWQISVEKLQQVVSNIVGDILISAAFVAYLGVFDVRMLVIIMLNHHMNIMIS